MVEKFRTILQRITTDRGPVNVFGILKMDELIDKWTVILSAPWLRQENTQEVFSYVLNLIRANLTEAEIGEIARLGLFTNDQHIVTLINNAFQITNSGPVHLQNTTLNGFKIHEAYIFESNRNVAVRNEDTARLPLN